MPHRFMPHREDFELYIIVCVCAPCLCLLVHRTSMVKHLASSLSATKMEVLVLYSVYSRVELSRPAALAVSKMAFQMCYHQVLEDQG